MNAIEKFLAGEIGITISNSNREDIREISAIVDAEYPDVLCFDEHDEYYDPPSIFKYWETVEGGPWLILVVDKGINHLNAYGSMSTNFFKKEHPTMTAKELLEEYYLDVGKEKEINENELMNLFA